MLQPVSLMAGGFRIPEVSTTGMAVGNALVADTAQASAMAYNPAAMSFQSPRTFSNSLLLGYPDVKFRGTGASDYATSDVPKPLPFGALTWHDRITKNWSWGINLNTPYGVRTEWLDESFPAFSGALDGLEPRDTRLAMMNINPNLALRLDEHTAVALGVDLFYVMDAKLNSAAFTIEGDGSQPGWNVALLHQRGAWQFGLTYTSAITVDLDGELNVLGTGIVGDVDADLRFPDSWQFGIRYNASDNISVEVGGERTGWHHYDLLVIEHTNPIGPPSPIVNENHWRDAWLYRVGGSYRLNDVTRLHAGFYYSETPVVEAYFAARTPDNSYRAWSAGVSHEWRGWGLDLAVMYLDFNERHFQTSKPLVADLNGTQLLNGDYEIDIWVLGLAISKSFGK